MSHWVYAASEYNRSNGEIVIFQASGYGTAVGFGLSKTKQEFYISEGIRKKNPWFWSDPSVREQTKIYRWKGV
jgi:hypothetical protein